MKIIKANQENGTLIVKHNDFLYLGYVSELHNGYTAKDCVKDFISNDGEIYDRVEINLKDGFKIEEWHDLYQYNCTSTNEEYIKELCKYFNREDLLKNIENPLDFNTKIISDFKDFEDEKWDHLRNFSFKLKNSEVTGSISFVKYIFLNTLKFEALSLDDLVDLHITLNKLLANVVYKQNETYYSCLERWAENNSEKINKNILTII